MIYREKCIIYIYTFGITRQEHILMINSVHWISEKNVSPVVTGVIVLTIIFKQRYDQF